MVTGFVENGWHRFARDTAVLDWVTQARPAADAALRSPDLAHWYQCENTWFVGVDALPNDAGGRVGDGPTVHAMEWAQSWESNYGPLPPLHRAQLSVIWQGYPRPRMGESEAAFRYRETRLAAHVDGLLPEGPDRRRFVREPHAFILGLPLNQVPEDAAPLVVWEGSHLIMRKAFAEAFAAQDPASWRTLDVTDIYQSARRTAFETCRQIPLPATPGEAVLLDRHLLHGVAAWREDVPALEEGRQIAYFRPEYLGGLSAWLAV